MKSLLSERLTVYTTYKYLRRRMLPVLYSLHVLSGSVAQLVPARTDPVRIGRGAAPHLMRGWPMVQVTKFYGTDWSLYPGRNTILCWQYE